jgi:hypothetical protein
MDTRDFCVYNQARGVFLSSKVTVADSANEPLKMLKVLVGGLGVDAESGLLLCPLHAAPAVPRLFPFDLLYLDNDNQVVDALEIVPGVEFPIFQREVASALLVAHHTLQSTKTARGDRLLIGHKEEIEQEIGSVVLPASEPAGLNGKSSRESKPAGNGLAALLGAVSSRFVVRASALVMPGSAAVTPVKESPARATIPEIAAQLPTDDAKSETETPVISITEVVLERPHTSQAPTIYGQQGGVEDLFSNWVDAPTFDSGWIAHNGAPEAKRAEMPRPASVPAVPTPPETASESTVSRAAKESMTLKVQSVEAAAAAASPEVKQSPQRGEKPKFPPRRGDATEIPNKGTGTFLKPMPSQGNRWAPPQLPTEVSDSTRIAQPPLATAYTVAQYGMWQVSLPTAANSHVSEERSLTGKSAAFANGSSKSEKAEADPKQAAMAKTLESKKSIEDLMVSASVPRFSSVANALPEKAPTAALTVAISDVADLRPLVNGLKTAVEQLPERVMGGAGQPLTAQTVLAVPTEVEKPKVHAADPSIEEIVKEVRKKGAAETKKVVDAKATVPTRAVAPDDKKRATATSQAGRSLPQASPGPGNAETTRGKISSQPGDANGKAKEQPLTLGMRFKRWLNPVTPTSSDRRKAYRRFVPGMVAHYYTGGAPKPHDVADISMTGIYLLTDDRWMPETMIQMTLQKPCSKGERKQSITVLAKIVRRGSDGVAAQFVTPETLDRNSHDVQPTQTTDRFALARFI